MDANFHIRYAFDDVFDDSRHFSAGNLLENNFDIDGKKIQVLICEDIIYILHGY